MAPTEQERRAYEQAMRELDGTSLLVLGCYRRFFDVTGDRVVAAMLTFTTWAVDAAGDAIKVLKDVASKMPKPREVPDDHR